MKPNLIGQRFGRLVVVKKGRLTKYKLQRWECVCDCGGTSTPTTRSLRAGTQSCGCLNKQILAGRSRRLGRINSLDQFDEDLIR